jgi:hypothetical protein
MERYEHQIRQSPDSDHEEIQKYLLSISAKNHRISILNYFKDMPVISKSKLSPFDDGLFEINPSDLHIKVIKERQRTILSMDDETILADCPSTFLKRDIVVVSGFRYIKLLSNNRSNFRIDLDRPINVNLELNNQKLAGMMKNISVSGCLVDLFSIEISVGMSVNLSLKSFDTATGSILNLTLNAEIVRVEGMSPPFECALRFHPTPEVEDKLMQFINIRQHELLRQIRDGVI